MASILRQIVASPRARHPEAGLDLCYVTDNIIATSGPGATYPQVAYRNPLKDLVKFLDSKHGDQWAIWEFRAEGTGYPDSEVYNRVWHYPWPDHHPPPFALIPLIMGSMRNWLKDKDAKGRVVVVHCKAGKGRSGTISSSYLISEEGWTPEDAMKRFTERRMRPGFGVGISIPSQQRWIKYVDRWKRHGKVYVERPVEILEVHVWGLRDGVKIAVEGYIDEGKVIKKFHAFQSSERALVRGKISSETGFADVALEVVGRKKTMKDNKTTDTVQKPKSDDTTDSSELPVDSQPDDPLPGGGDVVFRPSLRVVLPSSDINIDFERRNKTKYGGFTMVTSVAHVWFNTFFEGRGPEQSGEPDDSGVFELDWDAMDGIKGSSRKGTRAFDKFAVVWKAVDIERKSSVVINLPQEGEEVKQMEPADWRGAEEATPDVQKKLGLRPETTDSASISRASSLKSPSSHGNGDGDTNDSLEELEGVQSHVPGDEEDAQPEDQRFRSTTEPSKLSQTESAPADVECDRDREDPTAQLDGVPGLVSEVQHTSTTDLPDGEPESDLQDHRDLALGHVKMSKNAESSS